VIHRTFLINGNQIRSKCENGEAFVYDFAVAFRCTTTSSFKKYTDEQCTKSLMGANNNEMNECKKDRSLIDNICFCLHVACEVDRLQ
jgi:hypothetical protein